MNHTIFLVTPPQREAIRELAEAYSNWNAVITRRTADSYRLKLMRAGYRLLLAQDAFGIELVKRDALLDYLDIREAA